MATKSPISFTIKKSPRSKQFRCVVKNEGNHEPTFVGEPCHNHADVQSMIENHISAVKEGRFILVGFRANMEKPTKKKRVSRRTTKVTS